ncbi:MAG: Mov34/MPN/PAD-1 family protein [Candidatus Promineifilaceae bacterium]|nr:Mov34/MPN/PAD-1 family protein [Candidatus Promineifilaceae bacterium]
MTSASTYSETEQQKTESQTHEMQQGQRQALLALPTSKPPALDDECLLHGQLDEREKIVVILSQIAVRHIAAHSYSNLDCEVGGALLGKAYQHDGRVFLDIRAAIPAVTADQGPVHFTFTADAWSQLQKDRLESYPDLEIVGWFHTHPDLGVFYSSDDVVVHSAAFTQPWHVGMVIDPLRKETSFFGWQEGRLIAKSGFYERLDLQPYSLLEWQAVRTAVWDHPYDDSEAAEMGPSSVYLPPSNRPMLPVLKPYLGFIVGGLGLFLSLFLLVAWVLPLTREVDRLQNMVIVLADAAMAEGNAAACPDPRLRMLTPLLGQQIPGGSTIDVMGTAMVESANGYQVDVRPGGSTKWEIIGTNRRGTKLGELANWDTTSTPNGAYEMRLSAVDSNNIRLPGSPPCTIAIELVPLDKQ